MHHSTSFLQATNAGKKTPPRIRTTYCYFPDATKIVDACYAHKVETLVIRHPRDGGDRNWEHQGCQSIEADLSSAEGLLDAFNAIGDLSPKSLVMTVAPDRDLDNLRTEARENELIQEFFWRDAGREGRVSAYRSNSMDILPCSKDDFDRRFQALLEEVPSK